MLSIIELSESKLGLTDEEIEVEYQGKTIGKYGIAHIDGQSGLTSKMTDCLAKDKCGVPETKIKVSMAALGEEEAPTCAPGSGCC